MPILKPFTVNGVEYKSQTEYFMKHNPERTDATNTQVKMFCYHTIPEYRERIMNKNKMRYRNRRGGVVNVYHKFDFTNCSMRSV